MKEAKTPRSETRRRVLRTLGLGATLAAAHPVQASLLPKARRSEKFDVVVIGTGLAGMAAALEAQRSGAKVMVVEKMSEARAGGNTKLAGGLIAIPNDATPEARAVYLDDFTKKAQGRGNADLYKVIAERVLGDVDWLRAQGVEFLKPAPLAPYRISTVTGAPGPYFGMPKALATLRQKFTAAGGKIAYETKARQLIVNDRARVTGVKAVAPSGLVDYLADGIVIATGGYAGSRELMETFVDAGAGAMMVRGIKHATGDGHLMAHEAGAALVNMSGVTAVHIASVATSEPAAGNPFLALPYAVAINKAGKRFVDESKGYVAVGKATLGQPEQTVALVLGEETFRLPTPQMSAATFQKLGVAVVEAASLDDLAAKLAVPAGELKATIEAFNAAVQDGNKAPGATPPKGQLAHKVLGPKYYAFAPLKPGVTLTFGGIAINAQAQALEADGRVIRGLYAAGEAAGGLYYDDYIGGASLANCLVMGRIAGQGAAAEQAG